MHHYICMLQHLSALLPRSQKLPSIIWGRLSSFVMYHSHIVMGKMVQILFQVLYYLGITGTFNNRGYSIHVKAVNPQKCNQDKSPKANLSCALATVAFILSCIIFMGCNFLLAIVISLVGNCFEGSKSSRPSFLSTSHWTPFKHGEQEFSLNKILL